MKFIDFCSGIGGGRVALEKLGMSCVAFSEIDSSAEATYQYMFDGDDRNLGDLMDIDPRSLPEFDLLISGFPCQTFSIAGGRCGLADKDRGQIIYGIVKILKERDIKYFILENVKGLANLDNGSTLRTVLALLDGAGYDVSVKVLNSIDFGVPQMRERIYFVGVMKSLAITRFPYMFSAIRRFNDATIEDCLIDRDRQFLFDQRSPGYSTFLKYLKNKYNNGKYSVAQLLSQEHLILDTRQSDLRLYSGKVPTLRRARHGILYVREGQFRKLSGYEALLLQGFPKDYAEKAKGTIPNSKLLQQAGNAMTVPVVEEVAKELLSYIEGDAYEGKERANKQRFSYCEGWLQK